MSNRTVKKKDLRNFSLIWFVIFIVIGIYPLFKSMKAETWSIAISVIFLFIALIKPEILKNFYTIWVKGGDFIGSIITKIIMLILYFGLFTPISLVLKLLGKDLLKKKMNETSSSHWVQRETQPQSMKNQF